MRSRPSRRPRQGLLAWLSLLFPLGASLAAQVTWGLRTGSVVLVTWGCLATVLLALSIHRWRRLPKGLVRDLAMAGVVLAVGGWTWLHTALLLISELPPEPNRFVHYVSVGLCVAAFLPIEGLAVLSVLALDAPAAAHAPDESVETEPASVDAPQLQAPSETSGSAGNEPWGGPPTVDVPRPLEQPVGRTAAVTPMRRTTPSPAPSQSKQQRMTHEPGWTPDMAAVPRGNWSADTWVRRRARALPNITQAGKKHADLRREVERAELEQARRTAGSADDEDREAVPA